MKTRILSAARLSLPLATALAALFSGASAHAADGTWTNNNSSNWTTATNWSGSIIADGAGFTANFTGANLTADRTVTLGANRTIGNITFTDATLSSHNLIISGANILTLDVASGAPSLNVTQSDRNLFIGSVIAGNDGLQKIGPGTAILQAANTFTGSTTVSAGNLGIANYSGLDSTSDITVSGGSILEFRVVGSGATSDTVNKPVSLNGTLRTAGGTAANTLALTWDGNITLAGNSTLNNHGNGSIDVNGQIDLAANTLTFQTDQAGSRVDGNIIGTGAFTKTGTQTLVTTGANSYTGLTTISNGGLALGSLGALGTTPGVNGTSSISMATGSALRSTISGVTINAPISTTGSVTFGAPNNNAGLVFSEFIINSVISGASTTNVNFNSFLNANTTQTVTLNAANTYTGTTTIGNSSGGTASQMFVKLGINDALPTTTVLTIEGGAGTGTGRGIGLNLFGFNQTLAGLSNTAATSRVQQVVNSNISAPATLTINGPTNTTFSGNLGTNFALFSVIASAIPGSTNGNNFGLTKNGTGTFTISGGNTYSGATKILGGVLSLGNTNAMSQSPLDTLSSIAGDATNGLRTTVPTLTLGGLTGNKDFASLFETATGGYNTVTALTLNPITGATPSYTGVIADGAAGMTLTKSGAGTQTLAGANSYTGTTTVSAGNLILSGANSSSGSTAVNGGILTLDYSTQDNSKLSDSGVMTLGNATLDLSGGNHAEVVASTTLTAGTSSKITRSSGNAILNLNTITNGAFASIDFGAPSIATTDTLNNAYGILGPWATIGGTEFAVNSTNGPDGLITAPTNTDITRLNGGTQVIPNSSTANVRIIEGTGSPANITLAAPTTTINTLNQSATGGSSAATIDSGTQSLLTNAILVGTGAGALTIGNGTLTTATTGGDLSLVNASTNGFTINSVIANNTSASTLSKLGTGILTLTNANTYTGATTISAGTLQIGTGGTTGSLDTTGAIVLANSGNLTINRSNAVTQGTDFSTSAITGTGSFTQAGAGVTTLNAINPYSGPTTITAGTLNANSTDALGSGVAGNTLVFNGGTLQAGGSIASPSTRAVNFASTAVVDTNGNAVSFAGAASGVGGLTKNGTGTLTSTALNTFSGPITINGGTLEFSGSSGGNSNVYLSTQININNGSTLRISSTGGNQAIFDGRNYTFDSTGGGSILLSTGNYNASATPFTITTLGGATNTIGLITTSGVNGFNIGATTCTFDVALGSDAISDLTVTPIIANTGSIVKTGTGRLTITGANTYDGTTTINAGTLRVSGGNAIDDTGGVVSLADAASATFQVVGTETITALSGGGATGGTVSIDSAQTLSLLSGTSTFAGTIIGAGTLTNAGATQTLSGALSHAGGVNVTSGGLTLGSSSSSYLGTTAISAAAAGIIVTANNALGATGLGNGTTIGAAGALGFSGGVNYSTAETISGSGAGNATGNSPAGFTVGSRGFIQSISGNNSFAGNIELAANGNSRIGTQDGAQLTLSGPITQGSSITTANILFRVGNNAGDFVTLANAGNSFGGDSTVFTGASVGNYAGVRLGINNGHPTDLTLSGFTGTGAGASLDLAGFNQTLNGLITGAGVLSIINMNTVTPSTLTLNPTADKTTSNSLILGGGSLGTINVVKDGAFNQSLSGVNTYTGTTTVTNGTLTINDGSIANSSGIINNAALVYNLNTNARTYANPISGTGTLTKSGTNTLTLSGANTYTGNTTVSAGALTLADNAQLKFVTGATSGTSNGISGAGTVNLDGDFVIDTTTTDASALTAGTWTLVDASTLTEAFSGSFTVVGWTEAANVWTKTVGSKKYSFAESTGVLTLSPAASYASWINGFFPGETNLAIIGADADPDNDGIDNGVEMVIGGNPATGMDTALLPTIELVTNPVSSPTIAPGDYILFTFRRSDLSVASGVTANCETDLDLVGPWTVATDGVSGAVIQVDDNYASFIPAATNTDRVRVYVPRASNTKLFGRLKALVP